MNFRDKTLLVVGGTSGIGLAVAQHIVRSGGNVVVTGHQPDKVNAAKQVLTQLAGDAATPVSVSAYQTDLATTEGVQQLSRCWPRITRTLTC